MTESNRARQGASRGGAMDAGRGRLRETLRRTVIWSVVAAYFACIATMWGLSPELSAAAPVWLDGLLSATTVALWLGFTLLTVVDVVRRWRRAIVVVTAAWNLIPISIGIAVTRHGLYELDRVISRTVAYSLVTIAAIATYVVVVTSATWLIPGIPSVGVAVATLTAAAVFLPLLRMLQRVIDRRFDRAHYDAQRAVDSFGEHLRTVADPAATDRELLTAIARTVQPAAAGLWTGGSR